jgi:acetyl esterase/lipase
VDISRSNSIENRLIKLLRAMQATDASGNWRQFLLTDSTIDWSRISVAGHSQGGGHALFIAQRYVVLRASAYSSYGDYLPNSTAAAPWVTLPFATPTSRLAGFISSRDELVSPLAAAQTWFALGMTGAVVNVDSTPAPYGTSQRFTTTATPENPAVVLGAHHNITVVDVNTPKVGAAQTPLFADVWQAVSFP